MKEFDIQNAKKHLIAKMNEFDEITQEALKTIFNAIDNSTPKVEIEDERHQIFNGHRYWKNGRGYYQRVEFLHVAVMEYHIGRYPSQEIFMKYITEEKAVWKIII